MSIISEAFNKLLEIEEGEKIQIACIDNQQLHSFRTMLFKERDLYKKATGNEIPLTTNKKWLKDQLILEVELKRLSFAVVGKD